MNLTNKIGEDGKYIITDAGGNTVWRFPTATTVNDFGLLEGGLLVGGLGGGTLITLLTIAHAVMTGGKKRRKRRDAQFGDNDAFGTDFSDIFDSDTNWCGLRLTCELAAKAAAVLDRDEKMILSYLGGIVSAGDLKTMDPPELFYSYAAFQGFSSGTDKCKQAYGKCPYTSAKMMRVYKAAQSLPTRRNTYYNNRLDED